MSVAAPANKVQEGKPSSRLRVLPPARQQRRDASRILIIVQNLPVPFDRRVWLECQTLTAAGYQVAVVCPKGPRRPTVRSIGRGRALQVPALRARG